MNQPRHTSSTSPPVSSARSARESYASQRSHQRFDWSQRLQVSWLDRGVPTDPVEMETADLSAGGLSFRFRGMMHQGAVGVVLLKKSDGRHLLRCVEVVYCRYAGKSQHIIGARWIDMPPNLPVIVRPTDEGPRLALNL